MASYKISLGTAILMNINIMVGSGILIGPGIMAGISGNASFLTWLLVGLMFLPIVLSTVQMSRMCPGAGGFYAYAKEGLNKTAGYWSGWMYITGYTFAIAVEILALRQTLFEALGDNWHWLTGNNMLFVPVTIVICVLLNFLSLKLLSNILNSLTISKVVPLVALILLIPFIFNPSFTITGVEMAALPFSLPMAIFGYFGFEYCCSISHLIEDSERNAPLAILIGFFVTALLYMLFHFGLLNLMGAQTLSEVGAPAFASYITLPIPYLRTLLAVLIPAASAITLFAAANGLINANAVMLHAMAEERLFRFSPFLSQMTVSYRPWVTIIVQGVVAGAISLAISNIEMVGTLAILAVILSFILPFSSLIAVQQRKGQRGKLPLTVLALITIIGLAIYSLYALGDTMALRLFSLLPIVGSIILGALLFSIEEKQPA